MSTPCCSSCYLNKIYSPFCTGEAWEGTIWHCFPLLSPALLAQLYQNKSGYLGHETPLLKCHTWGTLENISCQLNSATSVKCLAKENMSWAITSFLKKRSVQRQVLDFLFIFTLCISGSISSYLGLSITRLRLFSQLTSIVYSIAVLTKIKVREKHSRFRFSLGFFWVFFLTVS